MLFYMSSAAINLTDIIKPFFNPFPYTLNLQQTTFESNMAKIWKISINDNIVIEKIMTKGESAHSVTMFLKEVCYRGVKIRLYIYMWVKVWNAELCDYLKQLTIFKNIFGKGEFKYKTNMYVSGFPILSNMRAFYNVSFPLKPYLA